MDEKEALRWIAELGNSERRDKMVAAGEAAKLPLPTTIDMKSPRFPEESPAKSAAA